MRSELGLAVLVLALACQARPGSVFPARELGAEPPPPAPEPSNPVEAAKPGPAETRSWEWALSVVPELANHSQDSPAPEAFERFGQWFAKGPRTIHLRLQDECFAVRGSVDQGFSYRARTITEGNTRTRRAYGLQITPGGIVETGPGGIRYERDDEGRWREVGGFGRGGFEVLVNDMLSRIEDGAAYFDGYAYTLTAECSYTAMRQRCEHGSRRTCERCSGIWLQPHAPRRRWDRSTTPVSLDDPSDCTEPCPAESQSAADLDALARVLEGRRFFGRNSGDQAVLFLRAKDCRRVADRVRTHAGRG